MVKLITYDLNYPGQNYENLYKAIKALGDYVHPMQNLWWVDTTLTSSEVRDKLTPLFDNGDKLFVADISGNWATNYSNSDTSWLKAK